MKNLLVDTFTYMVCLAVVGFMIFIVGNSILESSGIDIHLSYWGSIGILFIIDIIKSWIKFK